MSKPFISLKDAITYSDSVGGVVCQFDTLYKVYVNCSMPIGFKPIWISDNASTKTIANYLYAI